MIFRIKVEITAGLGGFKTLKNGADERIIGVSEKTGHVLFKVDSTPPWHCRQAGCRDPAISVKSDAVKVFCHSVNRFLT